MKEHGVNVHERNFKYIKAKHSEHKNADIGQYLDNIGMVSFYEIYLDEAKNRGTARLCRAVPVSCRIQINLM